MDVGREKKRGREGKRERERERERERGGGGKEGGREGERGWYIYIVHVYLICRVECPICLSGIVITSYILYLYM